MNWRFVRMKTRLSTPLLAGRFTNFVLERRKQTVLIQDIDLAEVNGTSFFVRACSTAIGTVLPSARTITQQNKLQGKSLAGAVFQACSVNPCVAALRQHSSVNNQAISSLTATWETWWYHSSWIHLVTRVVARAAKHSRPSLLFVRTNARAHDQKRCACGRGGERASNSVATYAVRVMSGATARGPRVVSIESCGSSEQQTDAGQTRVQKQENLLLGSQKPQQGTYSLRNGRRRRTQCGALTRWHI